MTIKKRSTIEIQWDSNTKLWIAVAGGNVIRAYGSKSTAVAYMAMELRDLYEEDGYKGQLIVKGKNGRIQYERTYPDDTPKAKG